MSYVVAIGAGIVALAGCASSSSAVNAPGTGSQPGDSQSSGSQSSGSQSDASQPSRRSQQHRAKRDDSYAKMPPLKHAGSGAPTLGSNSPGGAGPNTTAGSASTNTQTASAGGKPTISLDLGTLPPEHARYGALAGHRHRPAALPGRDDDQQLRLQQVASVVRRYRKLFQRCYERRLKDNDKDKDKLSGGLGLEFEINPSGDVVRAKANGGGAADEKLASCLTSVLRTLKFPAPEHGGSVLIRYPIH